MMYFNLIVFSFIGSICSVFSRKKCFFFYSKLNNENCQFICDHYHFSNAIPIRKKFEFMCYQKVWKNDESNTHTKKLHCLRFVLGESSCCHVKCCLSANFCCEYKFKVEFAAQSDFTKINYENSPLKPNNNNQKKNTFSDKHECVSKVLCCK